MQNRRFEVTFTQAEEAVAVLGHHGMKAILGCFLPSANITGVVIGGGHAVNHPLPITEVIVGGQDQVIGIVFEAWVFATNHIKVGETASID
jgi:hypothetical protein